jgi:exoribonuclease II
MYVVFDENGDFKAGSVISEAGGALQVETHTGKRIKVKSSHVVLNFKTPDPSQMMEQAQLQAKQVDLDLIWECAPADEFGFEELSKSYFGDQASALEAYALLIAIHSAPVYFYRKGRGRYRAASAETLKAALAAVEKRKQLQVQIDEWAKQLVEGVCPDPFKAIAAQLIVAPDKNGPHYKALTQACDTVQASAQTLLMKVGAFRSPYELHLRKFTIDAFPRGTGFKEMVPLELDEAILADLPVSVAQCFSIDDSSTTEIDDCVSVQFLDAHKVRVGVHIAAPSAFIDQDSPSDLLARERMSTLYMPGDKITMLPDAIITAFSLDENRQVPATSLYVDFDLEQGLMIEGSAQSALEQIVVAANLRHDKLDDVVTEAALEVQTIENLRLPDSAFPFAIELKALWKVAQILSKERDKVRGKPEARNRADYNFRIDAPTGFVEITERQRNAPLDRIVAEMMILANNQWGKLLAAHLTPAIYRGQHLGRVKMTTYPQAHQGLGVTHYGWFTSPLRRYSDMVNQRQLLAVLAAQAAPYAQNDARLHSVIAAFDARYAAYGEFQSQMEKYWCLRWLAQQTNETGSNRFAAVVVKPGLVRLTQAPLYFPMNSLPDLAPGRQIIVEINSTDDIELTVDARFIEASEVVVQDVETLEELTDQNVDIAAADEVTAAHIQLTPLADVILSVESKSVVRVDPS